MRLAWFSVRRGGSKGWMELSLGAGRARVRIDSRLDGFHEVAQRAAAAARERGLDLDTVTSANLASLDRASPGRSPGG